MIIYSTKESAEAAVAQFDNQNVEYGGEVLPLKCKMLGRKINQKTANTNAPMATQATGFFRSAMDNPE